MPGKLLIGQAGGATAVINRTLVGIIQEAHQQGSFSAILGMRRGAEGALHGEFVDLGGLDGMSLESIARTPGAALGSSRHKVSDDELEVLLTLAIRHGIDTFLYIGGNDSADTTHRLAGLA